MSPQTRGNLLLEISYATEKQLTDLLEKLLRLLLSIAFGQPSLQSATYARPVGEDAERHLTLTVEYVNPQGLRMGARGDKIEGVFVDSADFISERCTAYEMPEKTPRQRRFRLGSTYGNRKPRLHGPGPPNVQL